MLTGADVAVIIRRSKTGTAQRSSVYVDRAKLKFVGGVRLSVDQLEFLGRVEGYREEEKSSIL